MSLNSFDRIQKQHEHLSDPCKWSNTETRSSVPVHICVSSIGLRQDVIHANKDY